MRGKRPELRVIGDDQDTQHVADLPDENPADCGIKPPPALPPEIAQEWERVVADLRERRLWKDSMAGLVTSYVLAQATLLRLEIEIAAAGASVPGASGAPKPHPATGLLRSSRETVARLGAELGLSPTARSRKALRNPTQGEMFDNDEWDL